jgi:hypothetical protein
MSGSVLLHRQRSPEDLQLLLAFNKIRDTLFGQNGFEQDIREALELASVCEHPNAVWLAKLFARREACARKEARQVFLGFENDPRALCFAGLLVSDFDEILRAAELGDAFAQALVAGQSLNEERFLWAEISAAQGERDGFFLLGYCYRDGIACDKDEERAEENYLVAVSSGMWMRWLL